MEIVGTRGQILTAKCTKNNFRYAEYFDVAAGQEAPRWVGWTGLDGRASRLRLLLTGFECVSKLNAEYIREKMAALFSRNAND